MTGQFRKKPLFPVSWRNLGAALVVLLLLGGCGSLEGFVPESFNPVPADSPSRDSLSSDEANWDLLYKRSRGTPNKVKSWREALPSEHPSAASVQIVLVPISGASQEGPSPVAFWSVSNEGKVYLWDLASGDSRLYMSLPDNAKVIPTQTELPFLVVQNGSAIQVWGLLEKKMVVETNVIRTRAASAELDPFRPRVLLGGADGKIYRWNLSFRSSGGPDSRNIERYLGHGTVVSALLVHPDGRAFFSGDWAGGVSIWLPYDEGSEQPYPDDDLFDIGFFTREALRRKVSRGKAERIEKIVAVGREEFLLSTDTGALELWRVRGPELLTRMVAHSGLVRDVVYSPQRALIASLGRDGVLRFWRVAEKENPLREKNDFSLELSSESLFLDARRLFFLPSGTLLVSEENGRVLEVDPAKLEGQKLQGSARRGERQSSVADDVEVTEEPEAGEEVLDPDEIQEGSSW
ncbi:MAG: WD40 repeat domain-containing protein [Bdellovibrionales bacterium]|nr:WD40 repeat domain-containing protein [Bdellovibrionales bacterium]